MTSRNPVRRRSAVITALVLIVALSGCATASSDVLAAPSSAPAETATASPSPTVEAPAQATTVVLSGASVGSVDASGSTVQTLPYSAGAEGVVALFVAASGEEPVVSEVAESCAAAHTSYQWDGVQVVAWATGPQFAIVVSRATVGAVRVEAAGGYAVGDDVSQFVSAQSPEDIGRFDDSGRQLFVSFDTVDTVVSGEYSSPLGSVGLVDSGILTSIVSPGEWSSFLC